jgi:plastocyanin
MRILVRSFEVFMTARLAVFAFSFSTLALSACNDSSAPAPAATPAPSAAPAAPSAPAAASAPLAKPGDGVVTGTITLTGLAPTMPELSRGADPVCAKDPMHDEEVVVGKKGELKNVIVRIVGAPPTAPPETPVELDQNQCMYRPRVVALVAGQTLKIKNSDKTLHNIHTYKGTSTIFNLAQVPNMAPVEKHFSENGLLMKVKCDVHQWMTGWAWVQNNGLFAVTGDDGKFEIKGVPDGTWDIEAWQERYGLQKGKVTIAGKKPVEWNFAFPNAPSKG